MFCQDVARFLREMPGRGNAGGGHALSHIDSGFDPSRHGAYLRGRSTLMPIRPILVIPDPRLRLLSAPVERVNADTRALVDDMFATMYDAPGIGLAGIQVGVAQRIVVLDTAKNDDKPEPLVLINPQLVWSSEEKRLYQEGCLSIPEYFEDVERPDRVRVTYLDRDGAVCEREADGLLATAIQHEIDHLDGVLFIDHLSRLKRERVLKRFAKAAKRDGGDRETDA